MRRTARFATSLVTTGVVLAVVSLVALLVVIPRLSGATSLSVLSGSMEPTIPVGSVVLIRPVDPAAIKTGDVITYQAAPGVKELVTHRVIELQPRTVPPSFITKGDNNRGPDLDPVSSDAVRGEVWFHVPFVGHATGFVEGPAAVGLVALLGGLLVLSRVLGSLRIARERSTEQVSDEQRAGVGTT